MDHHCICTRVPTRAASFDSGYLWARTRRHSRTRFMLLTAEKNFFDHVLCVLLPTRAIAQDCDCVRRTFGSTIPPPNRFSNIRNETSHFSPRRPFMLWIPENLDPVSAPTVVLVGCWEDGKTAGELVAFIIMARPSAQKLAQATRTARINIANAPPCEDMPLSNFSAFACP